MNEIRIHINTTMFKYSNLHPKDLTKTCDYYKRERLIFCFLFLFGLLFNSDSYASISNNVYHINKCVSILHNTEKKDCQQMKICSKYFDDEKGKLIDAGKYCRIVIKLGNRTLYIWSFLKAKYDVKENFRYIKTTIYDIKNKREVIFFEGGNTLYIKNDYLHYNGEKYYYSNHSNGNENVFVEKDKMSLGRFILFERKPSSDANIRPESK